MTNDSISNLSKFIDFLNFIKTKKFYQDSDYNIVDSISNISKSDNSQIVFESEYQIINFDKLCENAYTSKSGKKSDKPTTVDGLFYSINKNKINIYFIEFKGHYLISPDYRTILSDYIKYLDSLHCIYENFVDDCPYNKNINSLLKNVRDTYVNEVFHKSLLKPYESLLIVLPKLYNKYCEVNVLPKKNRINDFDLFIKKNINFHYIFVGFEGKNNTNSHFDLRNKLNAKFKPLRGNIYTNCHVFNIDEFNYFFIKNIVKNPLFDRDKLITSIIYKIEKEQFQSHDFNLEIMIKNYLDDFLGSEFSNLHIGEYEYELICNEAFRILENYF